VSFHTVAIGSLAGDRPWAEGATGPSERVEDHESGRASSIAPELMSTRPLFGTTDMIAQHRLPSEAAELVDAGVIRTTLGEHFGRINAASLKRAHALSGLESASFVPSRLVLFRGDAE